MLNLQFVKKISKNWTWRIQVAMYDYLLYGRDKCRKWLETLYALTTVSEMAGPTGFKSSRLNLVFYLSIGLHSTVSNNLYKEYDNMHLSFSINKFLLVLWGHIYNPKSMRRWAKLKGLKQFPPFNNGFSHTGFSFSQTEHLASLVHISFYATIISSAIQTSSSIAKSIDSGVYSCLKWRRGSIDY